MSKDKPVAALTPLEAAAELEKIGIDAEVINIHTIKPLDEEAILKSVRKTGACVVAEEHQIIGGLGSRVAQVLASNAPSPIEFVGVKDVFGESGTPEQLLVKYGLSNEHIVEAAQKVISKRHPA